MRTKVISHTRAAFGAAVAALLTDAQRAEIKRLHDLVDDGWLDGCAAHAESANCCVDEIVEANLPAMSDRCNRCGRVVSDQPGPPYPCRCSEITHTYESDGAS